MIEPLRTVFTFLVAVFITTCTAARAEQATASDTDTREYNLYAMAEWRWPLSILPAEGNIYDPDQAAADAFITGPDSHTTQVPAFYLHPHERSRNDDGHEQVTAEGEPCWAVRYTPLHPGTYTLRLMASVRGEPLRMVAETTFSVKNKLDGEGFVRINPENPARFMLDTGKGYFALGHNVCWVKRERGTFGFDDYFRKMAEAGENYTRVWLCTWGISLDTEQPLDIDQADAWRLDHVLAEAARRGIYVKLCLDNFYDFRHHWEQSPFNAANGGPCATRSEFFSSPEARALYKKRLRYFVARYGAYTSLMAWELWNETNYALPAYSLILDGQYADDEMVREHILEPWTGEMAGHLRAVDPHRHLVTTSLGLNTVWPTLWDDRRIDFAQYHSYIHYLDLLRSPVEEDAARLVLENQAHLAPFRKPGFLAEFGYMGEGEASSMNPRDPQGIALHNAIWAGALSGGAGVPAFWWWDNYIDPNGLYHHYAALAAFLREVDWTDTFVPMRSEDETLRVLALRGKRESLLWIQNRENTWHKRLRTGRVPAVQNDVALVLERFPGTRHRLTWFDPYRNAVLSEYDIEARNGEIPLNVPPFRFDIAARLRLVKE